jgi:hypothetical protein
MNRILFFLIFLFLILVETKSFAEGRSDNIPCSSIADLDIENATINNINFADGEACTSDSAELPDQCDWVHEISSDEILRPITGKEVRLVILHSNHKTGSGVWDTALVFDCHNGSMRKIFEKKNLYGVKIKNTTRGEIILSSGDWQQKDPMCCPSKEKIETYRWSTSKNTYVLVPLPTLADDDYVTFAKSLLARDFDASLPAQPVEQWLISSLPKGITANWGKYVTDCGEQTGAPAIDKERDMPLCAEIELKLKEKAVGHLMLFVGSQTKGKLKELAKLYLGNIEQGNKTVRLKKLGDLKNMK